MSYFGRIASRIGAAPQVPDAQSVPNVMGAPAMRMQSPVVAADQRLSLPGVAEIEIGARRVRHHRLEREAGHEGAVEAPPDEPASIQAGIAAEPPHTRALTTSIDAESLSPTATRVATVSASTVESDGESRLPKIEASPVSGVDLTEKPRSAPKWGTPAREVASQGILGTLTAALARVDAWITSDSDASQSDHASVSESRSPMRRVTGRSESTAIAPIDRVATASSAEPSSRWVRMATRVADPGGTGLTESGLESLKTDIAFGREGEPAPLPHGVTAISTNSITTVASSKLEATIASIVERTPTNPSQSQRGESPIVRSEPVRPLAQPVPLPVPARAPISTPIVPEPPVLSIGHIEVQVVLPQKSSEPATARTAYSRAPRPQRASSVFEPSRRGFGWRQS